MPKPRRRLPKGIHAHESGSLYICYKNEHGRIIRENTHQTDVNAAELMLAQARTDVAMKRRFTSLTFESVKFIDPFNDWWKNHGSRTRSKFEYRTPRILAGFDKKKAREITPDAIRGFLANLREEGLGASSINQCRTILCSVFNYAIRFEKYDKNPVSVVPQEKEPPGRDRFPEPEEIVAMIRVCEENDDLELKAFPVLASTGMRKGEILSRKWSDIDLDSSNPCIHVRQTKNDEPKRIQLPEMAVTALRALPSYGRHEYVFPAKPNSRFTGNFKRPHAWDFGKRFRRVEARRRRSSTDPRSASLRGLDADRRRR